MRVSNNTEWLFFHLWKKNPETMLPCQNINIAETIIFRWAQPYFWYFTAKDGMIVRRTKEKIILNAIEETYLSNMAKCDVVATTLTSSEDANMKLQEKIEFEYILKPEFHNYLFQKEKSHNVIIQKFIEPKHAQNSLIKVAWTPQFCLFFRKTNINDINNQKIPLLNRLATFEGGEHLSHSDSISSPILASELEQTCLNIVKHIHYVTSGNVQISKMVLYFKLDDRNRLWLLFCTGLKLREKNQSLQSGITFKKKNERPLSPLMILSAKKDKDIQKPKIPLQYLLEDQINQIDDNSCLRCGKEDLLYDLKLKHILEHEEKIKKGLLPRDLNYEEEPEHEDHNFFSGGLLGNDPGKKNIPAIMKKLYPNLTEERYLKLKKNVSLMNMSVKLCESCYLVVTENMLANNEEKNAKRVQAQLRENVKKDETFEFTSLTGTRKPPGVEKSLKIFTHQVKNILEKEGILGGGPQDIDSATTKKPLSSFDSPLLKSEDGHSPLRFRPGRSIRSQTDLIRHGHTRSIYEDKKEMLPQILVNDDPKMYDMMMDTVKGYYSRTPKLPTAQRMGESYPVFRQVRSPYATNLVCKTQPSNVRESRTPDQPKVIKMSPQLNHRELVTREKTREKREKSSSSTALWRNKSGNTGQRTNFKSMISTIHDLKSILGQNLGDL